MSSKSKGCLTVILAVIVALGWWIFDGSTMRSRTLRSRLTLVVETPEGERTGSSVTQAITYFLGGLIRALGYAIRNQLIGETVVIDLGPRGPLVTTFETERGLARFAMEDYTPTQATFPRKECVGQHWNDGNDEYAAYLDELNGLKPKGDVPSESLPVLVRFRDPSDPTSVELVDPLNLAASFGSGVKLKRGFGQITDDPITHRIEDLLPWLASSKVSPPLFPPDFSKGVQAASVVEKLRYDDVRKLPN